MGGRVMLAWKRDCEPPLGRPGVSVVSVKEKLWKGLLRYGGSDEDSTSLMAVRLKHMCVRPQHTSAVIHLCLKQQCSLLPLRLLGMPCRTTMSHTSRQLAQAPWPTIAALAAGCCTGLRHERGGRCLAA